MIPISVIIPVRNAEHVVEECLTSIFEADPQEVIVVDGNSTDRTLEIARMFPVTILSDGGKGVPKARMMGIESAVSEIVMLIDVDIVLPKNALQSLFDEFQEENYDGLQAGLISISDRGYWGRALTTHHNRGRSKNWPGVMATLFKRDVLLEHRFDERFLSGEDIELRWRLQKANLKLGVSKKTIVQHRFDDNFEFAKGQFLADGKGLGRMVSKYRWPAAKLLLIPFAGSVRGIILSLIHFEPIWIPYFLAYLFFNYASIPSGLRQRLSP